MMTLTDSMTLKNCWYLLKISIRPRGSLGCHKTSQLNHSHKLRIVNSQKHRVFWNIQIVENSSENKRYNIRPNMVLKADSPKKCDSKWICNSECRLTYLLLQLGAQEFLCQSCWPWALAWSSQQGPVWARFRSAHRLLRRNRRRRGLRPWLWERR